MASKECLILMTTEKIKRVAQFEVYEDLAGRYRFRLRSDKGEVIASGQSYSTRKAVHRAIGVVQRATFGAEMVDL